MKFFSTTRSKVFAVVAAVMALSASVAYAYDCAGYCSQQANQSAQAATNDYLAKAPASCGMAGAGYNNCVAAYNASAPQVYNSVYSQTYNQCMGQCRP